MAVLEEYEVEGGHLTVEEGGLLRVVLRKDMDITAAHIREMHELAMTTIGRRMAILIDTRQLRSMDRTARQVAAADYIADYVTRLAVVVGGPVSAVIGNFFTRVSRPRYPVQLFASEDKAMAWLFAASK